MRRDLAALLVLFTPSFALADSGRDALDNTVSKALYATVPPGEKPADGTAAPKPGELVHNPPYAHWSQFKVGASVTVKEVVTQPDGSVGELSITSKLLSKSKEKVKVETTVIAGGAKSASAAFQTTKSVEVFPAMIRYEDSQSPTASGYSVTEGKEVIDIKGKQVEAEWIEASTTSGDETTVEKLWTSKDVPGGIVKQTFTKTRGTQVVRTSTDLVEYHAKLEPKKAP
jgi:hypothetical protein